MQDGPHCHVCLCEDVEAWKRSDSRFLARLCPGRIVTTAWDGFAVPGVFGAVEHTARCECPLGLGRECPGGEGHGILELATGCPSRALDVCGWPRGRCRHPPNSKHRHRDQSHNARTATAHAS